MKLSSKLIILSAFLSIAGQASYAAKVTLQPSQKTAIMQQMEDRIQLHKRDTFTLDDIRAEYSKTIETNKAEMLQKGASSEQIAKIDAFAEQLKTIDSKEKIIAQEEAFLETLSSAGNCTFLFSSTVLKHAPELGPNFGNDLLDFTIITPLYFATLAFDIMTLPVTGFISILSTVFGFEVADSTWEI